MDEREKRIVNEVIKTLRNELADGDGEYEIDAFREAVDSLLSLIDPDFDEAEKAPTGGHDYIVRGNSGSTIYQAFPQSEPARNFLIVMAGMDALWFGGSLCVEHRYIQDIINALLADGWKVSQQ